MADLSVKLCGAKMKSPLILASGIRSNNAQLLIRAGEEGAGAATSKSCSLQAREGHKNPSAVEYESYMINAIGLSNPGAQTEKEEIEFAVKNAKIPIIASVYENSPENFAKVAKIISEANPAIIELDASCPNIHMEGEMFSSSCKGASEVVKAVKRQVKNIPVSIKLAPNVPNIGEIAKESQRAGADCISAINTIPAMMIDVHARAPVLSNKYGGLSGPAIFPAALRCVNEIRNSCSLPIIGGGGVTSGEDAAAMLMAGATAVSVGTAIWKNPLAFKKINSELSSYMKKMNFEKISDIKMK
ncbi:dihydroorotate dehydrogenase [Candidatus Micrarchaeota archaeon CG10_big_fil_rev_8_21_14_0_10_45_29]|nr:MAG: dihydroorotate dehydrogenase [Candidatus Micrarchaeota archaeon CG10_big_fil_rev_8_21_14_0_10_45_29]